MTFVATPDSRTDPGTTAAQRLADVNRAANAAAILQTQPDIVAPVSRAQVQVEWVFGRDGALTALTADGRWWAGNSLPARSATAMLKSLTPGGGTVNCFLAPSHATQIRRALEILDPEQALIIVHPDVTAAWVALGCEDFSADLAAHRLWWVCGDTWPTDLQRLLQARQGLPVPSRFVKVADLDPAAADGLIVKAQAALQKELTRRAEVAARKPSKFTRPARVQRVCVIAGQAFRLWDDAGQVLIQQLVTERSVEWNLLDPDDPLTASPLAVREAAAEADAVVSVNVARADAPNLLPIQQQWITWLTAPKVPPYATAGPCDRLLVADPQWIGLAKQAGWPADRVDVAGWPARVSAETTDGKAALIANIPDMAPPASVEDFSSHRLLWEHIRDELLHRPASLGPDVVKYLESRMSRLSISPSSIDALTFITRLVVPSYQLGVARELIAKQQDVELYGTGWDQDEACRPFARARVTTREAFLQAVDHAVALVDPFPFAHVTQVHAMGKPVLRPSHRPSAGPVLTASVVLRAVA